MAFRRVMESFVAAGGKAVDAIPLSENAKVFVAVSLVISYAASTIFLAPPKKVGHDLASSEKPQALRKETERTLADEKRKALEAALLRPKLE